MEAAAMYESVAPRARALYGRAPPCGLERESLAFRRAGPGF
jgi:hypothetical protein